MSEYGYCILNALVTDIEPDRKVRAAMNEIISSKALKQAAYQKAEADKIRTIKAAVSASPGIFWTMFIFDDGVHIGCMEFVTARPMLCISRVGPGGVLVCDSGSLPLCRLLPSRQHPLPLAS
jgi:hypothetical protein